VRAAALGVAGLLTAAALLAAGCGASPAPAAHSGGPAASSAPAASASPVAGPEEYLREVRAAGLGDRDVSGQAQQIIHVGQVVCDGLRSGLLDYADSIVAIQGAGHHVTTHQATILADASIRNLCPEHSGLLPVGAP
jgi:hypothetical protein